MVMLLPSQAMFLWMYVHEQAMLSPGIEGAQSTLTDLLLFKENAKAAD